MDPIGSDLMTAIGVLMSLVGVAGAAGNCAILFLLLRCKKLQTAANMYVVNLAVADLVMCVGNFPMLVVSSFSGRWVTGYTGCKFYGFVGGLAGFVSINTLTAMACDRYSVLHRYKGQLKGGSGRQSQGFLVSMWIYSFFWAMPPFFGWGHFALDGGQISCCFDYLTRSASDVSYIVAIFVFCFGIQVVVIFFCYLSIVRALYLHHKVLRHNSSDIVLQHNHLPPSRGPPSSLHLPPTSIEEAVAALAPGEVGARASGTRKARRRKVEVQVTRLVVFITLSFCMSWLPFAVVSLIGVFGDPSLVTPLASVLPGLLAKIATVVNPVLYAIAHPQFRYVVLKRLRGLQARSGQETDRTPRSPAAQLARRAMLSSVYFASAMHDTNLDNSSYLEACVPLRGTGADGALV